MLDRATSADELNVVAGYDSDRYDDGWGMATSERIDPASGPAPGSTCDEVREWVSSIGGAHVGESWLQMLVQGAQDDAVAIQSIHARVIEREPPITESTVFCESAGGQEDIAIGFDLDQDDSVARVLDDQGGLGEPYFTDNVVTIAMGETVSFNIVGKATTSHVTWVLDLYLVVDGEERILTVGEEEGFQTTADTSFDEAWSWRWDQQPARLEQVEPLRTGG